MEITRQLAERIVDTSTERIPEAARVVARQALMDFIGVAIAGAREPLADILAAEIDAEGGHPQAQLMGRPGRASVRQAALFNGSAGHAHDYDDVHNAMTGHPTVPVAPAVLALAEHLGRSGAEAIAAFCAGVDAECILGRFAGPNHYARGWHATGTLGAFGAAAAAARMRQLDVAETAAALGIAGTQAAGLKSQFGTMCKPLHAGHAAATGVDAANLAARGFTSRLDILEADQGFLATQSECGSAEQWEKALAETAYTPDICFKYHAACYLTHSSIEAVRTLSERHDLAPNDVADMDIRVDQGHLKVCNIPEPQTGLEAKFSLRLTAAMAMAGVNTSSIDVFTDEAAQSEELAALRDRVSVAAHAERNPNSIVNIRTVDGHTYSEACNVAIPMTDLDAQWRKLETKFHALVAPRLGDATANAIIEACHELEQADSVAPLMGLLRSADG